MTIALKVGKQNSKLLEASAFRRESDLQSNLSKNLKIIPVQEIEDGLELLLIGREFYSRHGPIDILAVDQNGQLYILETKLSGNSDKRRAVAQVMDYAAALWRDYRKNPEAFFRAISNKYEFNLQAEAMNFAGFDEELSSDFTRKVAANLESGAFRLMVVMDEINDQLKDLIAYINTNSELSLYAIQLHYYKDESNDLEIIIPELYGAEIRKSSASTSSFIDSTKEQFWADVDSESSLFESLKLIIDNLEEIAGSKGSNISYGNKGAAGDREYFFVGHSGFWPVFVNTRGRLFLSCRGSSFYHEVHRRLRTRLSKEQLLGFGGPEDLEKTQLNFYLNRLSVKDVETLCRLYKEIAAELKQTATQDPLQ